MVSSSNYDVVVVGGGPAGSSAASFLADSDARVLVLDKDSFPRDKICGEGVGPRAVRFLRDMGLREHMDENFHMIKGVRIAYEGREPKDFALNSVPGFVDYCYTARRTELDGMLLCHARNKGVDVWENSKVVEPLVENGRVTGVRAIHDGTQVEVSADVVVGADGANSALGRAMGLMVNNEKHMSIAIRQLYEGVQEKDDHIELLFSEVLKPGYGWIFPIPGNMANVGVYASVDRIRGDKIDLHETMQAFVSEGRAAAKLSGAKPASPVRGALLRKGLGCSKVECPGLILVGDAASMINPLTGEGIAYALETGQMAAEHIIESRKAGSGFLHDPAKNSFGKKLKSRYGAYFGTAHFLSRHALGSAPFWSVHNTLSKVPAYRRFFIGYLLNMKKK